MSFRGLSWWAVVKAQRPNEALCMSRTSRWHHSASVTGLGRTRVTRLARRLAPACQARARRRLPRAAPGAAEAAAQHRTRIRPASRPAPTCQARARRLLPKAALGAPPLIMGPALALPLAAAALILLRNPPDHPCLAAARQQFLHSSNPVSGVLHEGSAAHQPLPASTRARAGVVS